MYNCTYLKMLFVVYVEGLLKNRILSRRGRNFPIGLRPPANFSNCEAQVTYASKLQYHISKIARK